MRFGRLAVCTLTASLFYGAFALAQVDGLQSLPASSAVSVPRLIRTNGSVRDDTGTPIAGNIGITFTLYKDAGGQVPVWQEFQNVKLDSAGRYTVLLGLTSTRDCLWISFPRAQRAGWAFAPMGKGPTSNSVPERGLCAEGCRLRYARRSPRIVLAIR